MERKLSSYWLTSERVLVPNNPVECPIRYQTRFFVGCNSSACPLPSVNRHQSNYDKEMADSTTTKLIKLLLYELKRCCSLIHNWKHQRYQARSKRYNEQILITKIKYWIVQPINFQLFKTTIRLGRNRSRTKTMWWSSRLMSNWNLKR